MKKHGFSEHIREVFDNFEDPGADFGWQELRKKYPEKKQRPLWIWWSSAAVFLLVSGLWLVSLNNSNQDQEHQLAQKKQLPADARGSMPATRPSEGGDKPSSPEIRPADATVHSAPVHSSEVYSLESPQYNSTGLPLNVELTYARPVDSDSLVSDAVKSDLPADLPSTDPIDGQAEKPSLVHVVPKPLSTEVMEQVLPPDNSQAKAAESNRSLIVSLFAGPHINYAENSQASMNLGAGFTSDLKVSNKLILTSGLGIASNSVAFQSDIPASVSSSATALLDTKSSNAVGTFTALTGYRADLLSLDVPVNVKYLIIPRDNKLFLSAGISSGTYLNETYSFDYEQLNGFAVNSGQNAKTSKGGFKNFEFARTLNFSMGFSSNSGAFTIEPFLKYPLRGQGSEDLKFGSSGINLRLNLYSGKKP